MISESSGFGSNVFLVFGWLARQEDRSHLENEIRKAHVVAIVCKLNIFPPPEGDADVEF